MMNEERGPLEEPAGDWFVNRRAELDLFWQWATGIPHPGRRSFALVGLRRTGKTAILHKTFNRLFNEQERVLPVYISFAQYLNRPEPITSYEFAEEYFAGYIRSYLAFRYRRPELHRQKTPLGDLRVLAQELDDERLIKLFTTYDREPVNQRTAAHSLMQWVINFPKGYAWDYAMPTAMFVDEFQVLTRVYNPDNNMMRNLTDSFQHAAETRYAPMLVSGSSVAMMVGEALSGLLSGRFQTWRLQPLSEEFAIDLALRLGRHIGLPVTEEVALALYTLTKGYPYSIERILYSLSPDLKRLPEVAALQEIVFFELHNGLGALREHYDNEYGKYVRQLNGDGATRKILYWLTNYPGEHLHPQHIAETLQLDVIQVQEALEKLYKLDIIQRASISTFWGPTDPLLLEFLKYEHYVDIEALVPQDAETKLRRALNAKQGEMNRLTGHFTEIIVAGVLNNYDGRTVSGEAYFGLPQAVILPRMEKIRRREGTLTDDKLHKIDVIGEYKLHNQQEGNGGLGTWLVAVRYRQERMGEQEVAAFIDHVAALQAERGYGAVTRWFVSKAGFTQAATARSQTEGIYFSDLAHFNALADLFGLLPLSMYTHEQHRK